MDYTWLPSMELIRRRLKEVKIFEIEHDYEIEISKFSDMLTKGLEDNLRKQLTPRRIHVNTVFASGEAGLKRILCADGHMTLPATAK